MKSKSKSKTSIRSTAKARAEENARRLALVEANPNLGDMVLRILARVKSKVTTKEKMTVLTMIGLASRFRRVLQQEQNPVDWRRDAKKRWPLTGLLRVDSRHDATARDRSKEALYQKLLANWNATDGREWREGVAAAQQARRDMVNDYLGVLHSGGASISDMAERGLRLRAEHDAAGWIDASTGLTEADFAPIPLPRTPEPQRGDPDSDDDEPRSTVPARSVAVREHLNGDDDHKLSDWKPRAERWGPQTRQAIRATKDQTYRKGWLSRLRTREGKLTWLPGPSASLQEISEWASGMDERRKETETCNRLRNVGKVSRDALPEVKRPNLNDAGVYIIHTRDMSVAVRYGMRPEDKSVSYTMNATSHPVKSDIIKWSGSLRSIARVKSPSTLEWLVHNTVVLIGPMPAGYEWGVDSNGIRLVEVATNEDFHPMGEDLAEGVEHLLTKLAVNREARRRVARQAAMEEAELGDIWVCVADSRTAGNCAAGIQQFAVRHRLDVNKHYRGSELMVMAANTGDSYRVKLSIAAARRRQAKEQRKGCCTVPGWVEPTMTWTHPFDSSDNDD